MNWQEPTALAITAATAGLFAWAKFRPRKFSFQRDTHCGCTGSSGNAPQSSIVFRARKGERSQVIVKMK